MLKKLRNDLIDNGFPSVAEKLEKYLKQTIRATTRRAKEDDFSPGRSKIGGLCHLPPDFDWPVFDGDPLHFIAQINLAELPRCPAAAALPDRGVMYFFYAEGSEAWGYKPEDRGAAVVHYYDGDLSRLKPTEKAPGETDITVYDTGEVFRFRPCAVTFEPAEEIPGDLQLVDLDELMTGVDPAGRSEVEKIMMKHMYALDECGGDEREEDEDRPPDAVKMTLPQAAFDPAAVMNAPAAAMNDPATAELIQKMSEHASKVLREHGIMSEGEDVLLSGKKGLKAVMKITEMLNCDSVFRNMLGLGDAPPPRGAPEDDGRDPDSDDAEYSGRNKMFGWPDLVQGNIFEEAQYVVEGGMDFSVPAPFDEAKALSLKPGSKDWELLFQIDSDGNADMMWGDMGVLYFMIKKDDLAARRFNRIWFSCQCH